MDRLTIENHLNGAGFFDGMAEDVRKGFSATPFQLRPKYLYDERGSDLFEQITELPEYYPMRAEGELLNSIAERLIAAVQPAEIVELAAASQRSARYQVEKHRKRVESSRNLPGMENIAPFFEVPAMPQALPDLPPATQHKGRTIRDTQTGKLLRSDGMIWKEVK